MVKFTRDEQFLISESPEISIGEKKASSQKLLSFFPAFNNRNYRLYFLGQLISLIGTWLQIVAQGWLVLELTNSALLIGVVAACATLPTLLFSLFGGVIVDRFNKKKILIFTQSMSMVLALVLGLLTVFKIINVWHIAILAFLLGTVNAVDAPARHSFVIEMVGRKHLASAIALNSGIFNLARVIGPSVAGILIGVFGIGGAFILNAASYVAVVVALIYVRAKSIIPESHPHPIKAIKEGLTYSFTHSTIAILLIYTGVVSVFGWSYTTILPLIAKQTFHVDAMGLGYLYAAAGLGALIATIIVSALNNKISPLVLILGGSTLFSLSIFSFTFVTNLVPAYFLLFIAGLGLLCQFATINTTIQHHVEDKYRGRVMSIYMLMFLGLFPIGNFQIGFLSEHFGTGFAMRLGMVVIIAFGIFVYLAKGKIYGKK